MNHESARSGSKRLVRLGSLSLFVFSAACGSKLDQNPFGPPPTAAGGVAGWVLNGEAGEEGSFGGTSAGRRNTGGSAADAKAGSPGVGGTLGGTGGSGAGTPTPGGTAGFGSGGLAGSSGSGSSSGGSGGITSGDPAGGDGGVGAEVPPPPVHALILSEYVEGSSNNKAVELHASEASTLDGCELHFYFNGGLEPAKVTLAGPVAKNQTYAVCTEELAVQVTPRCPRIASLRFNGNDVISLVCDGAVIDSLGKLGEDPGKGWGAGEITTVDRTLRRRCDSSADTALDDAFEPAIAWDALPVDSFDDLGRHLCLPDSGQAGAPGHGGDSGYAGEAGDAGEAGAAR